MKKLTNKRGISLIVLVITIIVMIILAASIILSLSNSGIISKANEAKTKSDVSSAKEVVSLAYVEWNLGTVEGYDSFNEYAEVKLNQSGYSVGEKKAGSYEVSETGEVYRYPVIPDGFVVSTVSTEDEISEGLVIYEGKETVTDLNKGDAQKDRNQFVWIPVESLNSLKRIAGYSEGDLQSWVFTGSDGTITSEPFDGKTEDGVKLSLSNDPTGEYAEYDAILKSIQKYGGFYIGRYEAGDGTTTSPRTAVTNSVTEPRTIVSKKEAFVYNYVPWGETSLNIEAFELNGVENVLGAVKLARSMYNESNLKSNLCYGIQWDAIMSFIYDVDNPNVQGKKFFEDSTDMGWYTNNKKDNPQHKTGIDLGENALNRIKNIYDIAGNVREWTMETRNWDGDILKNFRGGHYSGNGYKNPVSYRSMNYTTTSNDYTGFRVALYLV